MYALRHNVWHRIGIEDIGLQWVPNLIMAKLDFTPLPCQYISRTFTLEEGDVILTGTPAGVGAVEPGQNIEVSMLVCVC